MNVVEPPYKVLPAAGTELPLIVSIPHTGTWLPAAVEAALKPAMRVQPMTDWHLHLLYDFLPRLGVTVLHATVSRFVVDLNRTPANAPLYPGRFETTLVPTETFDGEPIWRTPPDPAEIEQRRRSYHAPYHAQLLELIEDRLRRFERCVLIDCHSVISRANRLHGRLERDVYLGNRDGLTCDAALIDLVERAFHATGHSVSRNDPYKGGYITDHYGRMEAVQALQIEMCQRLYMDEDAPPATGPAHPRFAAMREHLYTIFEQVAGAVGARECRCG
jgi:N-formylglutamate deformylase